jgi:hypothetical protein
MYFVMANRRLEIGDGRFFHDACLFRGSMYDVQQVCKLLKAARPDWTDAIQPVTAPCIFDAAKGEYINVERWI